MIIKQIREALSNVSPKTYFLHLACLEIFYVLVILAMVQGQVPVHFLCHHHYSDLEFVSALFLNTGSNLRKLQNFNGQNCTRISLRNTQSTYLKLQINSIPSINSKIQLWRLKLQHTYLAVVDWFAPRPNLQKTFFSFARPLLRLRWSFLLSLSLNDFSTLVTHFSKL